MIQGMAVQNLILARNLPPGINLRFWDVGVTQKDIHTAPGVFNFTQLQKLLAMAGGADVLYTFGKVPAWAGGGAAFANPPIDLASGNATLKAFVSALVNFSLTNPAQRIASYELWNEPNLAMYWTGTPAQLVQMVSDASAIIRAADPLAIIVGPAGSGGLAVNNFMREYLLQGGAALQDVFAYHAYLGDGKKTADGMQTILKSISSVKAALGIAAQPTWFTEGSWGQDSSYATPLAPDGLTSDEKIAYMAMQHIYMLLAGVARYYWYAWYSTQGWGTLWSAAGLNPVGLAYSILRSWLTGATVGTLNTNTNGTNTLTITLANGRAGILVWGAVVHSLSVTQKQYLSLDSPAIINVKNGTVTAHPKPILLIN